MTLISYIILLSLLSYWLVNAIRSPDRVKLLLVAGRKPWACNVCMSLWSSLASSFGLFLLVGGTDAILSGVGAIGGCYWLLENTKIDDIKL